MTFPPTVPCARVAWEPTTAEASRKRCVFLVDQAARDDGFVGDERADPDSGVGLGKLLQLFDAVDRDEVVGQGYSALASLNDEIRPACDGTGAVTHSDERVVERLRNY